MPAKRKHIPQRTCIACRQVKNKQSLVRIVKTPDKIVMVDETGKAQGRGAYLCKTYACWEKGLKGPINRALKTSISQQDQDKLKSYASNLL